MGVVFRAADGEACEGCDTLQAKTPDTHGQEGLTALALRCCFKFLSIMN